jgi:hypothetical protein
MYRFIWHIGGDLYYLAFTPNIRWLDVTDYEALTAEEIGQIMGGN